MTATHAHAPELRPPSVPVAAIYNPESQRFELGETDAQGRPSGQFRAYRPSDGSLYLECLYREGVQHGPFSLFHQNGQLAKRGTFALGQLEGEVSAYASDAATELPLRPCCVPPGAWELRSRYRSGRLERQVFYDREGHALSADGARWPARPRNVPEGADYDPQSDSWAIREIHADHALGRFFTSSGRLALEIEYRNGARAVERRFDEQERPLDERSYDADGRLHGRSARWFPDSASSPDVDARVYEERGQFWQNQPVGTFVWLDMDAEVSVRRELGAGLTPAMFEASLVFDAQHDASRPEALWALADELRAAGRVREAICAAARAAARAGESAGSLPLRAWLAQTVVPVRREIAENLGSALASAREVAPLAVLDQLLLGADPASGLRKLAAVFHGARRCALDFAEAALVLEPDAPVAVLTRALIALELGAVERVLADAARLESEFQPASERLRESVRVFFSEPGFWPAREPIDPLPEGAFEVELAQPLARVQRQIEIYATRHQRLRERLRIFSSNAAPPPWLPDLGYLLPRGARELERTTATIEDETAEGIETAEVTIDEALDLDFDADPAGPTATALMCRARANWAALTWLCWAVGLDTIASPTALVSRENFSAAVNMVLSRSFRARDQLQTGGLVSRTRGLPDFRWEGHSIAALEPVFASVASAEYQEIRAMFVWSMFAQNVSPFQSDIRADV